MSNNFDDLSAASAQESPIRALPRAEPLSGQRSAAAPRTDAADSLPRRAEPPLTPSLGLPVAAPIIEMPPASATMLPTVPAPPVPVASPAAKSPPVTNRAMPRAERHFSGQSEIVGQGEHAADTMPPAKAKASPAGAVSAESCPAPQTKPVAATVVRASEVRAPIEAAFAWRQWLTQYATTDVHPRVIARLVMPLMHAYPGGPETTVTATDDELLRVKGFGRSMLGVLRNAFDAAGLSVASMAVNPKSAATDATPPLAASEETGPRGHTSRAAEVNSEISGQARDASRHTHAADTTSPPNAAPPPSPSTRLRRARKPVPEIGGPATPVTHGTCAADLPPPSATDALSPVEFVPRAEAAEAIAQQIEILHRRAMFCQNQRVGIGNRLAAFVRISFLGFNTFGDTEAREKACKAAAKLIATARKGEPTGLPEDDELALRSLVLSTDTGAAAFVDLEEQCLNRMVKLARTLPAFAFVQKPAASVNAVLPGSSARHVPCISTPTRPSCGSGWVWRSSRANASGDIPIRT